jgi:hypothetical protein
MDAGLRALVSDYRLLVYDLRIEVEKIRFLHFPFSLAF